VDSKQGPDEPDSATSLRRLIGAHEVADDTEADAKAQMLSELNRLENPCEESADPVHVTASAIVVGPRGVILHRHRRLGRWLQPGGHINPGESPAEAALRESEEETGLSLRHPSSGPVLVHLDVHTGASGHTHLDLRYLLTGSDEDPDPPPWESPQVRWFSWEEAESVSDLALVSALRKARQAQ